MIKRYGRKLEITDSYFILKSGLSELGKNFGVQTQKSLFPYEFALEKNLFYIGQTPDISFYNSISIEDYSKIVTDKWDLKYYFLPQRWFEFFIWGYLRS